MKIGDKVRFLNEIGGGKVIGFRNNNIVLIEDEDGFEQPMQINDVVLIETATIITTKGNVNTLHKETSEIIEETPLGNILNLYLAYVPKNDKKQEFEIYLINDSNYYLFYTYSVNDCLFAKLKKEDILEPNTKNYLEDITIDKISQIENTQIQVLPYKRDKLYSIKSTYDLFLKVDLKKFYKSSSYVENDFFDEKVILYQLIDNDNNIISNNKKVKVEEYINKRIQEKFCEVETGKNTVSISNNKINNDEKIVIDLHANELLDSTSKLQPIDMLQYQIEYFKNELKKYSKNKGKKLIFIHGKGEGVLRRAIIDELKNNYKGYIYQDASFAEYGFGATQITIK